MECTGGSPPVYWGRFPLRGKCGTFYPCRQVNISVVKKDSSMLKKRIIHEKISALYEKKPIVLIYQYNNLSTRDWQILKNRVCSTGTDRQILAVKNKIARRLLEKHSAGCCNSCTASGSTVLRGQKGDRAISALPLSRFPSGETKWRECNTMQDRAVFPLRGNNPCNVDPAGKQSVGRSHAKQYNTVRTDCLPAWEIGHSPRPLARYQQRVGKGTEAHLPLWGNPPQIPEGAHNHMDEKRLERCTIAAPSSMVHRLEEGPREWRRDTDLFSRTGNTAPIVSFPGKHGAECFREGETPHGLLPRNPNTASMHAPDKVVGGVKRPCPQRVCTVKDRGRTACGVSSAGKHSVHRLCSSSAARANAFHLFLGPCLLIGISSLDEISQVEKIIELCCSVKQPQATRAAQDWFCKAIGGGGVCPPPPLQSDSALCEPAHVPPHGHCNPLKHPALQPLSCREWARSSLEGRGGTTVGHRKSAQSRPYLFFVGGLFQKQLITHLDIARICHRLSDHPPLAGYVPPLEGPKCNKTTAQGFLQLSAAAGSTPQISVDLVDLLENPLPCALQSSYSGGLHPLYEPKKQLMWVLTLLKSRLEPGGSERV